jgi:formate dehydrogenase subunit gamma
VSDAHAPERSAAVRRLAEDRRQLRGPLMPVLHAVLEEFGWIADEDIPVVADVLNLSRAEVLGVISFYDDFRRTPPPAHRLAVCRGEACQAVGADALYAASRDRFAHAPDVEVGEVFCLGNCALGPSGTIDGRIAGRLDDHRVAGLTDGWTS